MDGMGSGEWGMGSGKKNYPLPIPHSLLLLFTHVIIRGQPRLKLIISCGHIQDRLADAFLRLSAYLLLFQRLARFAVVPFCGGTDVALLSSVERKES
jgi:hypothetical protein